MTAKQRLVLCLDGTWNRQDSSTNVLHHFNLVREGPLPDTGVVQKKFYQLGVGTGVLDSLTGGGFGFGLEANVRDAYNWLIQHFQEEDESRRADEIYVFGFSRGAYTARSLVGFIAQCGLLRRGAPLTVEQLWGDYCILGRQKEQRKSVWEALLGSESPRVRPFTTLQQSQHPTPGEKLLLRWSRRVPITYLGIYDTVGAIGWDALAIPGLTSRMALHNNIRPTTLIQHCRHALAIDEHRGNFNHTPFIAYLTQNERAENGHARRGIDQDRAMWNRKIEQRWFVGAHSNIGGGYDDNLLAQRPLDWILGGAEHLGLVTEHLPAAEEVHCKDAVPRDSFAEFVAPVWDTILRNKRNFRIIDPAPKLLADRNPARHGFALESVNEVLDESVVTYWENSGRPVSPNLECYLKRKISGLPPGWTPAQHDWLKPVFLPYGRVTPPKEWFAYTALVIWTTAAVFGVYALDSLGGFTEHGLPTWVAFAVALFLPFIDWAESKVTFGYAVGAGGPRARAFLDSVYWTRTFGFVLFAFGALYGVWVLFAAGLSRHWPISKEFLADYGVVLLLAAAPALIITKLQSKPAWLSVILGYAVIGLVGSFLFSAGFAIQALFPGLKLEWSGDAGAKSLPGRLLLLQLAGVYFWRSLLWAAEPLGQANLGSITKLQLCWTPERVVARFEEWRRRLANTAPPDQSCDGAPAVNLRLILRHALWRDMIGFIPVYTFFLLFGLKFATLVGFEDWSALIGWIPIAGLAESIRSTVQPLLGYWWVLPLLAASTDYLEDACHLRYCALEEHAPTPLRPSAVLVAFSFLMTLIKDAAIVVSELIVVLSVLAGTHAMLPQLASDWRAKFAVVLTGVGAVGIALVILTVLAGIIRKRRLRAMPLPLT